MKTSPGFMSNTPDPKTVDSQIVKLQQRFHAAHITLMGDRGVPRGLRPEALNFRHVPANGTSA
ncbi:MAG: hypothetical protein NTV46_04205 [Verrucomicrobia bacterium]|nr:hypothetical protein [Verrucomicrobiota bacterium]